jgi:hypothetical protein
LSNGQTSTKFRMGTPSRRMVAIASRLIGAGVFTA